MKVQILRDYQSVTIDSCEADLDLETGNLSNIDFSKDGEKLDLYYETIDEAEYDYTMEMNELYTGEDEIHIALINNHSHSIRLDINQRDENYEPILKNVKTETLEIFRIYERKQNKSIFN